MRLRRFAGAGLVGVLLAVVQGQVLAADASVDLITPVKDSDRWAWSSWFTPFLQDDQWVFFAVTYDGGRDHDNAAFYVGGESFEVERDSLVSVEGGPIPAAATEHVIVGASAAAGPADFDGMLDSLRIYAGKNKSEPVALTKSQLEAVRRADLGPAWLAREEGQLARTRKRATKNADRLAGQPLSAVRVDVLDQCQLDEPHDYASYRKLALLARETMPGVKTKDAVNSNPAKYSPLVDLHVFALTSVDYQKDPASFHEARRQLLSALENDGE